MRALAVALVIAASAGTSAAEAQSFPSKPVTIVVPLAAGGAVDGMVRVLVEPMRAALGQPVLVENVGGAGGTIGITRVARAAPDGYTISIGTWGTHVANNVIYSPPYDLGRDFEPVALLPSVPYWIVGKKDLPAKDLKELIAWLKANKASAGVVGAGGGGTVCSRYFQRATGTDYQLIPYRGGGPALQDLVSGQLDLMCDLAANSLPQVKNGNVKAYAVMSKTRWFGAPDVPTSDEAGAPGVHVTTWHGAWAPKGTPKEAVDRLNAAIVAALADPAARQRLASLGLEQPPAEHQSPEAFGAYAKSEMDKWWPIIKAAGITAK
jgi:tripartite-type tricarboxylate transporter receptor subunit TctC